MENLNCKSRLKIDIGTRRDSVKFKRVVDVHDQIQLIRVRVLTE